MIQHIDAVNVTVLTDEALLTLKIGLFTFGLALGYIVKIAHDSLKKEGRS